MLQLLDEIATDLQSGQPRRARRAPICRASTTCSTSCRRARAQVGARTNRLETQQTRLKDTELNVEDLLSKTEDADMAKAMVDFSMQQSIYQSALQSGATRPPAVPARLPAVRSDMAPVTIESTRFGTIDDRRHDRAFAGAGDDRVPATCIATRSSSSARTPSSCGCTRSRTRRWRSRSCCPGSSTGTTRSTCQTRTWRRSASSAPTRSRSTASSTWRANVRAATINLFSPIVVNNGDRRARQVINTIDGYSTRDQLFRETTARRPSPCTSRTRRTSRVLGRE